MGLVASPRPASAAAATATTTTLVVTSGSSSVTTAKLGVTITLTATVKAGTTKVTPGLVNFCDASVTYCTDIHILGSAQLTSAGTAIFRFRPHLGSHSYKAVFAGTNTYKTSSSTGSALAVTGTLGSSSAATVSDNESSGFSIATAVTGLGYSASATAATGSVSVYDAASTILSMVSLDSDGTASILISNMAKGSHSIHASYSGDKNYLSQTSANLTITVK
jgi:hypothetical protein